MALERQLLEFLWLPLKFCSQSNSDLIITSGDRVKLFWYLDEVDTLDELEVDTL